MDKYVILPKKELSIFIEKLVKQQKVVAPTFIEGKSFKFQEIKSADEVSLDYIPTILPPKKYFMPQKESIVEFNKADQKWSQVVEAEELTIFGVHTCDLAGIQCLNIVFNTDPKDVNYNTRKDKITIIGFECNNYCDEFASCHVMDNDLPNGGYDLFFTDLGEYYMIHIGTDIGEKIVADMKLKEASKDNLDELEALRAKKREIFKDEVSTSHKELQPLLESSMESKVWEQLGEKCLACGNCTNVCPTCYCFDMQDEINLDFNTGSRVRIWDSCQNETFARVAGDENFREERGDRQHHRYMRKFNYPVNKYSRYFCTGCGRCSRTCMAKINMKETLESLK